jgi:hypothetical protein
LMDSLMTFLCVWRHPELAMENPELAMENGLATFLDKISIAELFFGVLHCNTIPCTDIAAQSSRFQSGLCCLGFGSLWNWLQSAVRSFFGWAGWLVQYPGISWGAAKLCCKDWWPASCCKCSSVSGWEVFAFSWVTWEGFLSWKDS